MTIKIKAGTYGFRNAKGFIEPKTPQSKPFSLTAEQEERLVKLGVAEYVNTEGGSNPANGEGSTVKKPNFHSMKNEEVQVWAKANGIEIDGLKRNEIIAKLKEVEILKEPQAADGEGKDDENNANNGQNDGQDGEKSADNTQTDGDDDDEIVETGEEAPTFDTTGAIK